MSTLPAPLNRTAPQSTAEAIEGIARSQAITSWVKDIEAAHRTYLQEQAEKVESMTGGAFNVPAEYGRAQMTDPVPTVTIVDGEVLADWLNDTVDPTLADLLPTDRVWRFNYGPLTADESVKLAVALDNLDVVTVGSILLNTVDAEQHLIWPEGITKALASRRGARVDGSSLLIPDTATGELVAVPGVTATPGRRDLRVTIDAASKTALRQQVDTILGPPTLAGPDTQKELP